MLLLLAALMQAPPALDADLYHAARTCTLISHVQNRSAGNALTAAMAAHSSYFLITAAVANPAGKPALERMRELRVEIDRDQRPTPAEIAALDPQCSARFPRSLNETSVTLPTKLAERAALCKIAALYLIGMFKGEAMLSGDHGGEARARTVEAYYSQQLSKARAGRGDGAAEDDSALVNEQLPRMPEFGTFIAIENSCEAAMH